MSADCGNCIRLFQVSYQLELQLCRITHIKFFIWILVLFFQCVSQVIRSYSIPNLFSNTRLIKKKKNFIRKNKETELLCNMAVNFEENRKERKEHPKREEYCSSAYSIMRKVCYQVNQNRPALMIMLILTNNLPSFTFQNYYGMSKLWYAEIKNYFEIS